jgi:catechol 2,3-dioxygenase-like lactoylglutathione lyase family enzyme
MRGSIRTPGDKAAPSGSESRSVLRGAAHRWQVINPIHGPGLGHIAFRVDNLAAFRDHLTALGIPFSDYGTAFAAEWDQLYFHDPEGTVVEVHQVVVENYTGS